jgi:hypothetical protein
VLLAPTKKESLSEVSLLMMKSCCCLLIDEEQKEWNRLKQGFTPNPLPRRRGVPSLVPYGPATFQTLQHPPFCWRTAGG